MDVLPPHDREPHLQDIADVRTAAPAARRALILLRAFCRVALPSADVS